MVGASSPREEEQARLSGARGEFIASLPRRLDVLRAGLEQLEEDPSDGKRHQGLLRRVHALGAAARVLGFATAAEVLAEAERALTRATRPGNQAHARKDVSRALDLLPSLVLGTAAAQQSGEELATAAHAYPLTVLAFGPAALFDALKAEEGGRLELERTEDVVRAREVAKAMGPDAAVIDADHRGAKELAEQLLSDPEVERVPLLVLGSFPSAEAATAYVTLGVDRVLPKPVSPETLRRTLFELHELSARPRPPREPVGEVTVDALADRIAQEVKRGLVEALEPGAQSTPVDLGDGADVLGAVWGAVARVRELVTVRSSGAVRFQPVGPEGAIPLAPWTSDERRAGERLGPRARGAEDVALRGRRILVADDDPAVVWFMSGLFRAVGAEVIEAHDGDRALELVFESAPDLVVSDVLMPGRDGFALCRAIKRDVVARDIPVILLSWKEDLLQRVRELGVDADGYLRKEASASTVVERVREVLRPRARIEQRLSAGADARGRLDGITPRLVLELVGKSLPDSTLTVRDAVYLYELQVRGGSVRSITRSAADGSFERGPRVLASLLGVSAGRFVVRPDSSACRAEFKEPLEALLRAPVRRARAALAALSSERLTRVVRVRVDREGIGRYVDCTPSSARKLIDDLASGASPRELLLASEISPRLLESVLSDLARRGAILGVEREDGSVLALGPDDPEPPEPARAAPRANVSGPPGGRAFQPAAPAAGESRALDVGAPSGPDEADRGWFSFQVDASSGSAAPAAAPVATPAGAVGVSLPDPSARIMPPVISSPIEPASAEAMSVFAALTQEPAQVQARAEPEEVVPASDDLDLPRLQALAGGPPSSGVPAEGSRRRFDQTLPLNLEALRSGPRPPLKVADDEAPSPSMADVFAAALADPSSEAPGDAPPQTEPGLAPPPATSAALAADSELGVPTPATVTVPQPLADLGEDPPRTLPGTGPSQATESSEPELEGPATRSGASLAAAQSELDATLLSEAPPPGADSRRDDERSARTEPPTAQTRGDEAPKPAARKSPSQSATTAIEKADSTTDNAGDGASVLRTTGLALAAFAAAFGLVRFVVVPALQPDETAATASAEAPPRVGAPPLASAVRRAFALQSEDTALPSGAPVTAGAGLLDVTGQPGDQIFIDGVFIARGARTAPLRPGRHLVRVVRTDQSAEIYVDIVAGRQTRVRVTSDGPAKPAP